MCCAAEMCDAHNTIDYREGGMLVFLHALSVMGRTYARQAHQRVSALKPWEVSPWVEGRGGREGRSYLRILEDVQSGLGFV